MRRWFAWVLLVAACGGSSGPEVAMDFEGAGFYDAPFPSDHRVLADGRIDLAGFPTLGITLVESIRSIAETSGGFGRTSAVFFRLSAPIDPARLPDAVASVTDASPVFLLDVDPESPGYLTRRPLTAHFAADGGRYGAPNLLALLPVQGIPLRARTRYAAVVLRRLTTEPLAQPHALRALVDGDAPAGLAEPALGRYRDALGALSDAGVDGDDIGALAVFTTGDPEAGFRRIVDDAVARPLPVPGSLEPDEIFDGYCVYSTTIAMPTYQTGAPPYATSGGAWADTPQGVEQANLVLTVPRAPMPPGGYPIVVFSRTGAGGERPLVDRGPHPVAGGQAAPGTGLARDFAAVGWAGLSIDGPHGGLRNVSHGDEQFLVFNVVNPTALRDNVRQSALELVLAARLVPELAVDASGCPGAAASASFDGDQVAVFGHSMGAWIAPLAGAVEPRIRALVLSGAGGSWIENVLHKKKPLEVRPLAQTILGYGAYALAPGDPVLSLLQWAGEPADPQVYGARLVREPTGAPRNVLVIQGVVDHYIMPAIANALNLSVGLDLAGPALDEVTSELDAFVPLATLLPLAGASQRALPVSGNAAGGQATAIVVQHREDGVEDGHEALYQLEAPRRQVRCFLATLAQGIPNVCE